MNLAKILLKTLVILLVNLVLSHQVFAHMMVAQHGTLNIVDDGAFMVLSLPVSAFNHVDDNNDGELSNAELAHHRANITQTIQNNIVLKANHQALKLEGILLSLVTPHHGTEQNVSSQLIVMGRFSLTAPDQPLQFHANLFGTADAESVLNITATRKADKQKHTVTLTPNTPSAIFF